MAKAQGKGVFVGAKIKVSFPKSGTKKDNSLWQLFTYQESKKNQETGRYDEIGRYTIFVNNPQKDLQNNDIVTIKNITKILTEKNKYNGKDYININCWCEIEKSSNNNLKETNKNQSEDVDFEKTMDIPSFDENFSVSPDELPF